MDYKTFFTRSLSVGASALLLLSAVAVSGQEASATGRVGRSDLPGSKGNGQTRARISRKTKRLPPRDRGRTANAVLARRIEKEAFLLINRQRKAAGVRLLKWNPRIASLAREHSNEMALHRYFSHTGLDGRLVDKRAIDKGLDRWRAIGENIAYMRGYDDPAAFAVERWMLSPTHRDNLLDRRWKESAIGLAISNDGTYYFTQVFMVD